MSLGGNFRSHLLASTGIAAVVSDRIHQTKMSEQSSFPAIWFQRVGEEEEITLDGEGGLKQTTFDLECISTDLDESIDLGITVKRYIHGWSGTLSGTTATVQGVFVRDKDDDYIPRNEGSDDGRTVSALSVEVWSS